MDILETFPVAVTNGHKGCLIRIEPNNMCIGVA